MSDAESVGSLWADLTPPDNQNVSGIGDNVIYQTGFEGCIKHTENNNMADISISDVEEVENDDLVDCYG